MVTGSLASAAHGRIRTTEDIDIVIAPTERQLLAFVSAFPNDHFYADDQDALESFRHKSQFNIIDFATAWKIDPKLDRTYIERWVNELSLQSEWQRARSHG